MPRKNGENPDVVFIDKYRAEGSLKMGVDKLVRLELNALSIKARRQRLKALKESNPEYHLLVIERATILRDYKNQKMLYAKRRKLGGCIYCGKDLAEGSAFRCDEHIVAFKAMIARNPNYKAKCSEARRKMLRKLKLAVLNGYGGPICRCCGETHIEFLSIDHINNDGAAHRRSLPKSASSGGSGFYAWLKKNNFPPGFQVLCMNCNFAKGKYGYCPHEKERRSAQCQKIQG